MHWYTINVRIFKLINLDLFCCFLVWYYCTIICFNSGYNETYVQNIVFSINFCFFTAKIWFSTQYYNIGFSMNKNILIWTCIFRRIWRHASTREFRSTDCHSNNTGNCENRTTLRCPIYTIFGKEETPTSQSW